MRPHPVAGAPGAALPSLLGAGIVATTLAVAPGLPHAFESPKEAVVGLLAGAGAILLAWHGLIPRVAPRLAVPLAAWLAAGAAAAWAGALWSHVLPMQALWALVFVVGLGVLGAPAARERLFGALALAAGIESALALVQYVLGAAVVDLLGTDARRWYAFGTLGVPNWIGALGAAALPAVLGGPSRRRALLVLLLPALVVTGSRGAWLAAAVGVAAAGPTTIRALGRARRPLVVGATLAVAAAAAGGDLGARTDAGTVGGRLLVWRATVEMIAARPVLGTGPGGFAGAYPEALHAVRASGGGAPDAGGFVGHAHALLLQVAAETGLAGLAALLWMGIVIWRAGAGDAGDPDAAPARGALGALLAYGLTDDPLASPLLALVGWLAAAALAAPTLGGARPRAPTPRLALGALGVAAALGGLAALRADRLLGDAWEALARGDEPQAATLARGASHARSRGQAEYLRGLLALRAGDPVAARDHLAAGARLRPDPDVFQALAVAEARVDPQAGRSTLGRLSTSLPRLIGPRVLAAELALAAGDRRAADTFASALARAGDHPSARLEVLVTAAGTWLRAHRGPSPRRLVVIDPGHGGTAVGARGPGALEEKTLTLRLAKRLAGALRVAGMRVALTRHRDRDVSLPDRARHANRLLPDLFVSLHANAAPRAGAEGIELHVRGPRLDAARFPGLTDRDLVFLESVAPALLGRADGARALADGCSRDLAARVLAAVGPPSRGLRDGSALYLLRLVAAPALLVEVGFLTNPAEARRLARPSHQRRLVAALAGAVERGLRADGPCQL